MALALTGGFMAVEAAAGLLTGSLALLSDAVHMLSDTGALALAVAAQRMADRPRTRRRTFGDRRAETLAALANAVALGASAVFIVVEALGRFGEQREVDGGGMLAVACAGLGINLASAWVLSRGEQRNANLRAALAHVLSDAAGSVAAIVAGMAIVTRGWTWADPACSLLIATLVALAAWRLVKSAAHVLMEGTPAGLDLHALERTIRETQGVADLHDLHAWRIEEGFDAATVHVVLEPGAHGVEVARAVALRIRKHHGVEHVTVQPEAAPAETQIVPVSALRRSKIGGG
jgi:cobalt-zinc-cadmium efflux system protein